MIGDLLEFGSPGAATFDQPGTLANYGYLRPQGMLTQLSTTSGGYLSLTGSSAAWVYEAAKKLEALGRLRAGWDSYGGRPLSRNSRELTVNVLGWLSSDDLPTPAVVLGSEGDVHLEWRAEGRELEVELGNGGKMAFVKVYPNGNIEEREGQASLPLELRGLAWWLMHG